MKFPNTSLHLLTRCIMLFIDGNGFWRHSVDDVWQAATVTYPPCVRGCAGFLLVNKDRNQRFACSASASLAGLFARRAAGWRALLALASNAAGCGEMIMSAAMPMPYGARLFCRCFSHIIHVAAPAYQCHAADAPCCWRGGKSI